MLQLFLDLQQLQDYQDGSIKREPKTPGVLADILITDSPFKEHYQETGLPSQHEYAYAFSSGKLGQAYSSTDDKSTDAQNKYQGKLKEVLEYVFGSDLYPDFRHIIEGLLHPSIDKRLSPNVALTQFLSTLEQKSAD